MSRLKVLFHHRTQGRGVEAVHILNVLKGIRDRGHDVTVMSPPGADPEMNAVSLHKSNHVWQLLSSHAPEVVFEILEILYNFAAGLRMLKFVNNQRVDVLYERYALFLFIGVAIASWRNIPVVLEVNDSASVKRVRPLLIKCLARMIERWVFKKATAIITVTEAFKNIIVMQGVDPQKVHVIHNAADEKLFSPVVTGTVVRQRYGLQQGTVVGFVGKVVPWHGVDTLLRAVPHLVKICPDVRILIVGDTSGHRGIEEIIASLGIASLVYLTGQIPHADVPSYIAAMDIAVMPNSNEFGSPVKIFEYMAMGRAIIAPRCKPVEEVLEDGKTALIVDADEIGQLVTAIKRLTQEPNLRSELGEAAYDTFVSRHTWDHNNERTIQILSAVGSMAR